MGSCYNTSVVNAPIAAVWDKIRNFHKMDWAAGVITSVEPVGDVPGDEPGAGRVLNEAIHETLRTLNDDDYSLTPSTTVPARFPRTTSATISAKCG
jgi:hypothetical protein